MERLIFSAIGHLEVRLWMHRKYELISRRGYITSGSIVEYAEIFKPGLFGQSHKSALLDART